MNWNEKCLLELSHHNLFESTDHRQRFRDLIDCYFTAPFFTKGLCKCIYIASWDDEHFIEILAMLNDLTASGAKTVRIMSDQGVMLTIGATGVDAEIYKLSTALLTDTHYELPDFASLDPDGAHIIRMSLMASALIDDLPDPHAV